MKTVFVLIVMLFLTAGISAQKVTTPKPTPPPLITIEATTKDGKNVVLKSDGTWEYAPNQTRTSAAASATKNISLEAALVFRSGDVKPVARTTFYLLDEDLVGLLTKAGIQPSPPYSPDDKKGLLHNVGYAYSPRFGGLANQTILRSKVESALKGHIVREVTTDFNGKAEFTNLESKTYYLFGVGGTPRGFALWSMEVPANLKSIVLDQNNMATGL